ncbi:MAG TPA: tyrosine-type recombinase/integrase [Candidatus Saccharimonadia bacterium]|nr:tyrosine-type recombinase/integrase [Candidatus Saccharimonadia bacterium]
MTTSLRDHHKAFLDELKKKKKASSTLLAYGKDVEQFIEWLEQQQVTDVSQITKEKVEEFSKELQHKRYTDKSVVRKINSLKAFFSFLVGGGVLTVNPVDRIERPKFENAAPRILTKLEYRALRDVCRSDRRISAIVELLLQTGIRISELAALKIDDFDATKKTLSVKSPDSESLSRTIPLNNAAVRSLQDYLAIRPKAREKTIFVTKTLKPFLVRNIRSAIDRYFRLAGIKNAKVNDLRHTFIVEQLMAGTPLVYVSQLVGHKRITTTEKYLQFLGSNVDTASMKIEEL